MNDFVKSAPYLQKEMAPATSEAYLDSGDALTFMDALSTIVVSTNRASTDENGNLSSFFSSGDWRMVENLVARGNKNKFTL